MRYLLLKPAISFASLLILFIELVALPFFLNVGNKKIEQTVSKTETCCAKKATEGSCSKSADGGTEGPECCVNCPLFYVMIAPQFIMPEKCAAMVERSYPVYNVGYQFIYSCSSWKPPDIC